MNKSNDDEPPLNLLDGPNYSTAVTGSSVHCRGSSSAYGSLASKQFDNTQAQISRTASEINPYKPSKCYPVFWSRDDIRLLELDSSSSGSLLHGSFTNVRLGSEQAQYEAVSYTWAGESGDSTRCRPMFIGPFWDIVPITRNCENALRSIRISGGPSRKIWIDSLCIHQDDEKERSAQVALMPRIYANAAGVLVYLGAASEDSDMALDTISRSIDGYTCAHPETQGACEMCAKAIKSLFQRPFFRRLWVVQEVTLGKSLIIFCGSRSTFWPFEHITRGLPVSIWTQFHQKRGDGPEWELLGLMAETSQCFCSDSRDRIFALLGMLQRVDERTVAADYSLTQQEVSIGIASYLVQKCGRGREVLLFGGINRGKRRRLPTWVPDFAEPLKPDWRIRGLLDRSLAISGVPNTAVEARRLLDQAEWQTAPRRRLAFQPLKELNIQISSRTSGLHLSAIKLCNLKSSFRPFGEGRDYQPFVRHGLTWRAVVLVPKAPCGSGQSSSWLNIVSAEDDVYWLYGIEGFAILRPNYGGVSHSLVCACDVVFETSSGPSERQKTQGERRQIPLDRIILVERLSELDENMCSEHLQRILEQLPTGVGPDSTQNQSIQEEQARESLLDIAFGLKNSQYRAEEVLWESWQRMERLLLPLLQCEKGLATLQDAFNGVDVLPFGSTEDCRPRKLYVFQGYCIQSFDTIAELLWSLLPSEDMTSYQTGEAEPPDLSAVKVLKELKDWADLTTNLFSAVDQPKNTAGTSLSLILPCSGIQQKWRTQWTAFQKLMPRGEALLTAQDILSIFSSLRKESGGVEDFLMKHHIDEAYRTASEKHLLWDWDYSKISIGRQQSFWKNVKHDKWLRSWSLFGQQDHHKDGIPEQGNKGFVASAPMTFSFGRETGSTPDTLKSKLALRLYFRGTGFNLDSPTNVTIR
ncbi:heterokaryon incompatibility protein [Colletotrichum sublineola]|nr:heterokaryon incompatibility protein [Colletotrichum sublineola]